ncbi:MAG: hypothetical protein DI527_08090 [Chelatococcus sp.]|nr:MAG: hypothetical protein DI527_08090 [Chelatococcus sp.]
MPRLLLLLPAMLLGACAIHTSRTSVVVLTESKGVVEACTKLGDIDGDSTLAPILLVDQARDSAMARLKIRAADLGGTHVLTSVADPKWKGPDNSGVVYKCTP